jgi:CRISPR-associated protein Csm4
MTPLHGDTLFGHICWGIKYSKGEEELNNFLSQYDEGNPPLVVSDGFPAGMLPFPALSPGDQRYDIDLREFRRRKLSQKTAYLDQSFFLAETPHVFSLEKLTHTLLEEVESQGNRQDIGIVHTRMHNAVNRISGTVEDQALYTSTERWFLDGSNDFDVYLVSRGYSDHELKTLLENALEHGYGADSTTGKGVLSVEAIEEVSLPKNGNRCMALGKFVPSEQEDLTDLRADTWVKYGKLGGEYVLYKSPFKKPIVMYQTGATFAHTEEKAAPEWVGTLLAGVHHDERIRHHAMAPVIPFYEEEGNE